MLWTQMMTCLACVRLEAVHTVSARNFQFRTSIDGVRFVSPVLALAIAIYKSKGAIFWNEDALHKLKVRHQSRDEIGLCCCTLSPNKWSRLTAFQCQEICPSQRIRGKRKNAKESISNMTKHNFTSYIPLQTVLHWGRYYCSTLKKTFDCVYWSYDKAFTHQCVHQVRVSLAPNCVSIIWICRLKEALVLVLALA